MPFDSFDVSSRNAPASRRVSTEGSGAYVETVEREEKENKHKKKHDTTKEESNIIIIKIIINNNKII